MISSSKLQEKIVECLSDQENHSVQEIKNYLAQNGVDGYTEGQFAGSINTMQRNGTIRKIDRGVYSIRKRSEDMKKCFVICPIGEEGTETRANSDIFGFDLWYISSRYSSVRGVSRIARTGFLVGCFSRSHDRPCAAAGVECFGERGLRWILASRPFHFSAICSLCRGISDIVPTRQSRRT